MKSLMTFGLVVAFGAALLMAGCSGEEKKAAPATGTTAASTVKKDTAKKDAGTKAPTTSTEKAASKS